MRNDKHNFTASALLAFWALMAATLLPAAANAAMVDFEPVVGTITGTDTFIVPFEVTDTGPANSLFRGTLTDFGSPAPFISLGWIVVTEDNPNVPLLFSEPGQVDFGLDPGNYLAVVGGIADADLNIGTFGLEISDLPLPAGAWLLLSCLLALGVTRRRKVR